MTEFCKRSDLEKLKNDCTNAKLHFQKKKKKTRNKTFQFGQTREERNIVFRPNEDKVESDFNC